MTPSGDCDGVRSGGDAVQPDDHKQMDEGRAHEVHPTDRHAGVLVESPSMLHL